MPFVGDTVIAEVVFRKNRLDAVPGAIPTVTIMNPAGVVTANVPLTPLDATNFPGRYSYSIPNAALGNYRLRWVTTDATMDEPQQASLITVDAVPTTAPPTSGILSGDITLNLQVALPGGSTLTPTLGAVTVVP